MASGVPTRQMASDIRAANRTAIIGLATSASSEVASRSSPAEREPLTSTTSPGASSALQQVEGTVDVGYGEVLLGLCSVGHCPSVEGLGHFPDRDKPGDPELVRQRPGLLVGQLGLVAQLGHLAEHRPAASAAGHGHQRLERGPYRLRVGVVGVVDHGHAVGPLGDLHAPAAARYGCRAAASATSASGTPELQRDGGRGQRVGDHVRAVELQRDLAARPAACPGGTAPGPPSNVSVVGPHVGAAGPVRDDGRRRRSGPRSPWPRPAGRRR